MARLISQKVKLGEAWVTAVIDIGAVVSVIDPELMKELKLELAIWQGLEDGPSGKEGVTTGKTLVKANAPIYRVLMVNLTEQRKFIRVGTAIGSIEEVDPVVVTLDEERETEETMGVDVLEGNEASGNADKERDFDLDYDARIGDAMDDDGNKDLRALLENWKLENFYCCPIGLHLCCNTMIRIM